MIEAMAVVAVIALLTPLVVYLSVKLGVVAYYKGKKFSEKESCNGEESQ